MSGVSVVIPVKDGARFLPELLAALEREGPDEVIVIDSGSSDGSAAISRAAGVRVEEIAPEEFAHGATRNMGAELAAGDFVAFLTQDATPVEGWLSAYLEAFCVDSRLGAAFGPHLPRPGTSPILARELREFFAGFSAGGGLAVHQAGDISFLSNVNSCYRRVCWQEIRFRDVAYAEDQAFGEDMLRNGWRKGYVPGAAVLHAHDYGTIEFMRRYFDEYRGLRAATGHVEPFGARSAIRSVRKEMAHDRRFLREAGAGRAELARWTARSAAHHSGRRVFSALGSRADRLPSPARRLLSLERRVDAPASASGGGPTKVPMAPASGRVILSGDAPIVAGEPIPRRRSWHELSTLAEALREGPVPLLEAAPGQADREQLHIAMVIPMFRRGSGGHQTLFQIMRELELKGHTCSIWHHDAYREQPESDSVIRGAIREHFVELAAPVFKEFDQWFGADVVIATSWITVYPVVRLPWCRARVYMVSDHEREFFPTSIESHFAALSYQQDLWCIAGTPWLRDVLVDRYAARASVIEYGVDHRRFRPRPEIVRRRDTVAFYARLTTPRRAAGLGYQALGELKRRRPGLRIVAFGDADAPDMDFDYEHLGIADEETLACLYAEATIGMCLSMTNFSRIPKEMMAAGLPCVELAGFSAESIFGADGGPLVLAELTIDGIADAIEGLLNDPEYRAHCSEAGLKYVAQHTWEMSARLTEEGLRDALRAREREGAVRAVPPPPPDPIGRTPVTDRLSALLSDPDREAILETLDPDLRNTVEHASEPMRSRLLLHAGIHNSVQRVTDKTSLTTAFPPDDVHAMARGWLSAGGAFYEADFVIGAAEDVDAKLGPGSAALDFGCSSGRVVRACAAAFPEVEWHGCDPNAGAVAWAGEHIAGVAFQHSATEPPLGYAAHAFDLVYAVSIWSHFAEEAALHWFDEMARIMRPGGALVITTHGFASVEYYSRTRERSPSQLEEIRHALSREGFWYQPEFGEEGDHGVVHPQWGTAFLSAEWLMANLTPRWQVAAFFPGANAGNQDLYSLRLLR